MKRGGEEGTGRGTRERGQGSTINTAPQRKSKWGEGGSRWSLYEVRERATESKRREANKGKEETGQGQERLRKEKIG